MTVRRATPGFEGYAASADGRIWSSRSVERDSTGRLRSGVSAEWRELKPSLKKGYPTVAPCVDGRNRYVAVHQLVLLAWRGPPPPGMEACHENGDRGDCRLANLRWDTRAANHADKRRHGTAGVGERNPAAKLSEGQVREIRRRRAAGERVKDLAAEFGIHPVYCSDICRGVHRHDAPLFAEVQR